jgi:hypothetical protein
MPEKIKYHPLDFEYRKIVREISTPVTIYSSFSSAEGKIVTTYAVLIGMDIIMMGNFIINNKDGKTLFSFVIPPIDEIISFSKIVGGLDKI